MPEIKKYRFAVVGAGVTGAWIAREKLIAREDPHTVRDRGIYYNHSTFCDLVISGLFGVKTDGGTLAADPIIPEGWDFMRLSRLPFRGKLYTIVYDRTGEKFGMGSGVHIFEE